MKRHFVRMQPHFTNICQDIILHKGDRPKGTDGWLAQPTDSCPQNQVRRCSWSRQRIYNLWNILKVFLGQWSWFTCVLGGCNYNLHSSCQNSSKSSTFLWTRTTVISQKLLGPSRCRATLLASPAALPLKRMHQTIAVITSLCAKTERSAVKTEKGGRVYHIYRLKSKAQESTQLGTDAWQHFSSR